METKSSIDEIATDLLGFSKNHYSQNYDEMNKNKGKNNRICRIDGPNNSSYAVKSYGLENNSHLARLENEFRTLNFLYSSGLSNVPEPVLSEKKYNCSIYKWIEGKPISKIGLKEINQAVKFISKLNDLKNYKEAKKFELAKEACLSGDAIVNQIMRRYYALMDQAAFHSELSEFLRNKIGPILPIFINKAKENYLLENMSFSKNLEKKYQTLSPSDFGFHNSLRKQNGEIHFVDFEYFGWDDPVKLVCDFILHPGMKSIKSDKSVMNYFAGKMEKIFVEDLHYKSRVDFLVPLYALRWILIILNEYIPQKWEKRKFAGEIRDRKDVLENQLKKAYLYYEFLLKLLKSDIIKHDLNSFLILFCNKSLTNK